MNAKLKWVSAGLTVACGLALILWNLRDPDAAYREPPMSERVVTIDEVPLPVRAAIGQVAAGGTIEEIQEKRKGAQTKYEVDFVRGSTKTEVEFAENGTIIEQESKQRKRR